MNHLLPSFTYIKLPETRRWRNDSVTWGGRLSFKQEKNQPLITDKRQVLKIWENYITELYDRPNRRENIKDEPEEEVDADEQGPHILQSEVETREAIYL